MTALTVGSFLTQLEEKGFPVNTKTLPIAVGFADKIIKGAEINEEEGVVDLYLLDGGFISVELGGLS